MDRGVWWATVCRVANSWTRLKQLSMHASQYKIKSFLKIQTYSRINLPLPTSYACSHKKYIPLILKKNVIFKIFSGNNCTGICVE